MSSKKLWPSFKSSILTLHNITVVVRWFIFQLQQRVTWYYDTLCSSSRENASRQGHSDTENYKEYN